MKQPINQSNIINILLCIILLQHVANAFAPCSKNDDKDPQQNCDITYYDTPDAGACNYGPLFGDTGPKTNNIVAINTAYFKDAQACGSCYKVTGPSGTITVIATDECPAKDNVQWCSGPNIHFDLNKPAFDEIGEIVKGFYLGLNFTMVPCDFGGNLKIKVKAGSMPGWAQYLVYNHRVPVKSLAIKVGGSNFTLRITSIFDEVIEYPINKVSGGSSYDTNDQFNVWGDIGCVLPSSAPSIFATPTLATLMILLLINQLIILII
ncbi:hypothetical protein SAMD00019534_073280 [Acytostelium subglobosum LB1]|uniref:hypothetical protein n=1 Tax=Acytostelium subglobosum LB1 TaxID=1410327 RepID=UPI000644FB95|nr:hypothetical protein SAMD00019534_073280 [Acytostelium subglobosum LB1]GAM24153.1 hypothetical protein SAMD00019534_073280 [Acytostelium subglobosum LB1]|eukprot:XP_012753189.1 hypothetical protein SAMD00019534_073280 [Acytostelium subglobosum LB1]